MRNALRIHDHESQQPQDAPELPSSHAKQLMDELNAASNLLHSALDRYFAACSAIRKGYVQGNIVNNVPPELTNSVNNEMNLVSQYELKIDEAIAAISAARNCSSSIAPISALPAEILIRIFQYVISQRCSAGGDRKHSIHDKFILPKHSVHLSHVCSRWRYISNGAAVLWSHIDLSTSQNLNRRLFTRAKVFTSRAGETPLDIHIIERKEFGVSCGDAISDLVEFLTPIASHVRSVKINLNSFYLSDTKELCTAVFATCFGGATPGALKRLELYKGLSSFKGGFIKSVDDDIRMGGTDNDSDDEDGENIKLDVSRETLEDVWRPITVMHLRGFYPHWASRAYHGLVELRLAPTDQTISEFALAAILAASPGLRVLELGLSITDPLPEGSPNIPVRLNELELLITRRLGPAKIDSLFGLVDLSSKPLDIVVVKPFDRETEIENELEPDTFASGPRMAPFLSRSNVARVCVVGLEGYEEAIELLNFAPGISTLILEQFEGTGLEETIDRELASEEFSLHTLCLWGASRMAVDNLRLFVEMFQIQKLQLWGCRFRGHSGSRMVEQESVESELIDICPEVELRPSTKPHPDHNWDLIDSY